MLLKLEGYDNEYKASKHESKIKVKRDEWCERKRRKNDLLNHLYKVKQKCDKKDLSEFNDIVSQFSINVLYFFILVVEIESHPIENRRVLKFLMRPIKAVLIDLLNDSIHRV